jgi:hypothetical protein
MVKVSFLNGAREQHSIDADANKVSSNGQRGARGTFQFDSEHVD